MFRKICKTESLVFPQVLLDKLMPLTQQFSTSLFVILQTIFKLFLRRKTGNDDIMIGTYVFGRDYPGSESQVGCYAKTVLVRTVFDKGDSISDAIRKVNKSNEDMRTCTACPLKTYLEGMVPPEHNTGSPFWNINVQFSELDRAHLFELGREDPDPKNDLTIHKMPGVNNSLIAIDMQLEFLKSKDKMTLVIKYDSSLYNSSIIKGFSIDYINYAEDLLNHLSGHIIDIEDA